MNSARTIEGIVLIDRIPVHGHVMREVETGVFVCERCGLTITVDPDRNPVPQVFEACHRWSILGRGCV